MVWKKTEVERSQPESASPRSSEVDSPKQEAIIGPSIFVKGDLSGDEDLIIQGKVKGKVDLKQHNITVGRKGRVTADLFGKSINVEGEVEGNLLGAEKIVIRSSGKVHGNISGPRVILEEGCQFKGSIDMDHKTAEKQGSLTETVSEPRSGLQSSEPVKKLNLGLNQPVATKDGPTSSKVR